MSEQIDPADIEARLQMESDRLFQATTKLNQDIGDNPLVSQTTIDRRDAAQRELNRVQTLLLNLPDDLQGVTTVEDFRRVQTAAGEEADLEAAEEARSEALKKAARLQHLFQRLSTWGIVAKDEKVKGEPVAKSGSKTQKTTATLPPQTSPELKPATASAPGLSSKDHIEVETSVMGVDQPVVTPEEAPPPRIPRLTFGDPPPSGQRSTRFTQPPESAVESEARRRAAAAGGEDYHRREGTFYALHEGLPVVGAGAPAEALTSGLKAYLDGKQDSLAPRDAQVVLASIEVIRRYVSSIPPGEQPKGMDDRLGRLEKLYERNNRLR